ncbi:MAG: slipin family protein [Aigarchaeota archaeon]|nr:slipin family protein [Aigarchaeota archaeon]MDW8093288.1 slipin family protein [Nitrososphaerota archaeon]
MIELVSMQINAGTIVGLIILIIFLIAILSAALKVVKEYERVVVLRLGRLLGSKGPGLILLIPFIDSPRFVDLRVVTLDVPKQRIITKDNVTVDVDAVVYFRVQDPIAAIMRVRDYFVATSLLSQTTLRDVIGQVEFDDLLARRDELNKRLQSIIDEATEPWGIKVISVSIKDVIIPEGMQRAIAKQAEAERERRSRIIMAEGEREAAEKMEEAASYYARTPQALRLRELQTWAEIAREKNLIIVTESSQLGSVLGATLGVTKKRES